MLLFFDPRQKRSGWLEIGPQDTSVTLSVQPTAAYGGTLLDDDGQPLEGLEFYLGPAENFTQAIVSQSPDATGKFHWDAVPVGIPLTLRVRGGTPRPYYIRNSERQFEPGEVRADDQLRARQLHRTPEAATAVPLAQAVPIVCRDARLNAMRALILLVGDNAQQTRNVESKLLDTEETAEVLAYRVLSVPPEQQANEAAAIAERKWPKPAGGEVVCLVLEGDESVTAQIRLDAKSLDTAVAEGRQFLTAQRPARRDALAMLAAARDEAKSSGRKLWVVSGSPRCGPCFRLGRWMDDQHATLEKDYVLVKVIGGLDRNAEVVSRLLPGSETSGIPFHAILEPDGKVLITSTGPLGNIGMPGDVEGIRHLRKMLEQTAENLSAEDIDALVRSLTPE